jgi:hypothetical protein
VSFSTAVRTSRKGCTVALFQRICCALVMRLATIALTALSTNAVEIGIARQSGPESSDNQEEDWRSRQQDDYRCFDRMQAIFGLTVVERQSRGGLEGRPRCRPPWSSFSFERRAPSVALHVHLQDCRMVNKPVNRRKCHSLIGKDLSPFSEGLIGCDQQRAPFVAHTRSSFMMSAPLAVTSKARSGQTLQVPLPAPAMCHPKRPIGTVAHLLP